MDAELNYIKSFYRGIKVKPKTQTPLMVDINNFECKNRNNHNFLS